MFFNVPLFWKKCTAKLQLHIARNTAPHHWNQGSLAWGSKVDQCQLSGCNGPCIHCKVLFSFFQNNFSNTKGKNIDMLLKSNAFGLKCCKWIWPILLSKEVFETASTDNCFKRRRKIEVKVHKLYFYLWTSLNRKLIHIWYVAFEMGWSVQYCLLHLKGKKLQPIFVLCSTKNRKGRKINI